MATFIGMAENARATDGVVGPGNCNEAGFDSVLATVDGSGGGTVTFNCGTATFAFTNYKQIANAVAIDGGGHITFDGGNSSAFFQVFASANVTLKGLKLQHGVFNASHAIENFGTLMLDRVSVVSNTSSESPLMNYGSANVVDSTFSGNASTSSGGAIGNFGTMLSVSGSTFNGNSAATGAAIYSEADLAVANSTFSANAGTSGGGSIYQANGGNAVITFVTIVGNTAPFGAGLFADGNGTMTVMASVVSANTTGNCDGLITSNGYNLSDDGHCGGVFTGPGDLNGVTLEMRPLGDYGGPTRTQPPQAGNPAIDRVPRALAICGPTRDQRGAMRPGNVSPYDLGCDSGAVELGDVIYANDFEP